MAELVVCCESYAVANVYVIGFIPVGFELPLFSMESLHTTDGATVLIIVSTLSLMWVSFSVSLIIDNQSPAKVREIMA